MMNRAIKLLVIASLSAFSLLSVEAFAKQSMKHKVIKDDCFVSKNCLVKVSAPLAGQSYYLVNEVCDDIRTLFLYKLPLKDQISNNEYLGTQYCHGVVSYSDMNLPFSVHTGSSVNHGILDANDGRLLINTMEHNIKYNLKLLDTMSKLAKASISGSYGPAMQVEFEANVYELNRISSTTIYGDLFPLNSASHIDVPVDKGSKKIHIDFYNFSSSGLNLVNAMINNVANAKSSITTLQQATAAMNAALANIQNVRKNLQAAADRDATITSINLGANDIVVQKQSKA